MDLKPIEKRTGLTKEEFQEEYFKKDKPVIFTDFTKDWPATEKWTFDYFRKNHGHLMVPVFDNDFRKAGNKYLAPAKEMKFGDYLTLIENEPTELRMFLFNIFKHVPELVNDIRTPDVHDGFLMKFPMMFFGGQGSKVDLHYDLDCATVFLSQFLTRKKVVLFENDERPKLYHHPFTVQSHVELDRVDFNKHPAFKKAKGYEGVIDHGETLFMPSLWWHYIYYLDGGFSLSLRSHTPFSKMRGGWNISRHFVIDQGMNKVLGSRWTRIKDNLAARSAKRAIEA
ncbi:MAG: cupin-like domain-containing protein [Saprospiraceae bacterium]|nr:cupin-like domain-containing protein [Saprospiraceae bacterium]